jgi:hypothetical protein
MVVMAGGGSAFEAGTELLKKKPPQRQKTRVASFPNEPHDIREIPFDGGDFLFAASE